MEFLRNNIGKCLGKYPVRNILKDSITPIAIFFISRVALFMAVYSFFALFGQFGVRCEPNLFSPPLMHIPSLMPWSRWDASWYAEIASSGYANLRLAAFFPLFPYLIKIADLFIRNPALSGIIVANICFLLGLVIFHRLIVIKSGDRDLADRAALYLAIFPTSFFFASGLSESTFFLMSVATFYFAERENWPAAAVFGALTALTRSVGFVIVVPVVLIYLMKRNFDHRKIRLDILPILMIPLGLVIFMMILLASKLQPLDFIRSSHEMWWRIFAWPWWDLWRGIEAVFHFKAAAILPYDFPVLPLAGVFLVVLFLIASILVIYQIDLAYGVYVCLLVLFALSNPGKPWVLYGNLRFILVAFPVFILFAKWGKCRLVDYLIVIFSLLFLAVFAAFNGFGGWIS